MMRLHSAIALLLCLTGQAIAAAALGAESEKTNKPEPMEIHPAADFVPPPASPFWQKVDDASIGSTMYNLKKDLRAPDDVWLGVYKAFEPDTSFVRKILVDKTKDDAGRERLNAEVEIVTEEKGNDCLIRDVIALNVRPQEFWETDGSKSAKQVADKVLLLEDKKARYEPMLQIKPDRYTQLGKENPGKYFFYSCYLCGFKNNVCIKGRLMRIED